MGVNRNSLIMGIASVFVGITALMLISGIVVNLFFIFVAIPFAAAAYLMWYQASGRLAAKIRANPAGYARSTANGRAGGGFDAGPFQGRFGDGRRSRQRAQGRQRAGGEPTGLSAAEAADILGVAVDADPQTVKAAYREQVKTVHPDAPEGDEEQFKAVKRAYETLGE